MKILVRREKSFGKAIPAQAGFILKPRRHNSDIRNRDELHTRGRGGVESRELASACRQRQREGLAAIAEEIPAGQNVILAEVVIDFDDHAAQVVKRRGNY